MDISVVIATYNQKERLRLVLSALGNQRIAANRFEILVVDDGSEDGTHTMLKSLQSDHLHIETFTKNWGRCHARNAGINKARGALVVFLDGDALPAPDLLQRYSDAHKEYGDKAVFCGDQYVLPHLEYLRDPQTGSLFDIPLSCTARRHLVQQRERIIVTEDKIHSDFPSIAAQAIEGGYPFPQILALQKEFHELCKRSPDSALAWLGLYPHNMAVPLALLRTVGGFDEAIPFCEGWELGYRLRRAGAQFIRARASSYHLYHYHDFSDPLKAERETAKRHAAIEHIARKHDDPLVHLIHFWWAHLWPNPFFPDETVIRSLVEFDQVYRTMSAQKWRAYHAVLDSIPTLAINDSLSCDNADQTTTEAPQQRPEELESVLQIAETNRKKGRREEALSQLEEALNAQRQLAANTSAVASILVALGRTHELGGDLAKAEHCYDQAITIYQQTEEDLQQLAVGYSCKGFIRQLRGDFSAAIDLHTKSLRINEKIAHTSGVALDFGNLGIVHFLKGDLATAEQLYRKSKAIYEELNNFSGVADQYNSLANLKKSQGRLDEANELVQRALAIDTESERKEGLALHNGLLSSIELLRGEFERALEHGKIALEINQSLADLKGQAYAYGILAEAHLQLHDTSLAEANALRSIELFERIGMAVSAADRYLLLGRLYTQKKDFTRAEQTLHYCLQLLANSSNQQTIATAKMSLSLIHIERQDYDAALRVREEALAIHELANEAQPIAYGLASLGEVYALKKEWDHAGVFYKRALAAFEKMGDESGQAIIYDNMGDAAASREQNARACALWKLASMRFARVGMSELSANVDAKIQAKQLPILQTETTSTEAHSS